MMGVIFENGYSLPSGDQPLTHARIAHAGNWHAGAVVASATDSSYFAAGPNNTLSYEKWKPTTNPATWELDFGVIKTVDYCAIGAHTLGTYSCELTVQYYDGSNWIDVCDATALEDDMPIFVIFTPVVARRFRVSIKPGAATLTLDFCAGVYESLAAPNYPTIGVVKFGQALQMPRPLYGGHVPLELAHSVNLRSSMSETGEFLGRTKQRTAFATNYAWANIPAAWVRSNWLDFQAAVETEPFFLAWRPATFPEVGFCQVDEIPVASNAGVRDLMVLEMAVRAYGYR